MTRFLKLVARANIFVTLLIFFFVLIVPSRLLAEVPALPADSQITVIKKPSENVLNEPSGNAEVKPVTDTEHEKSAGVLGMLGVNWKLFLAQLINFGIILAVLWKWVFGPVAKGLEARTRKIEKSLMDAKGVEEEKKDFVIWKNSEIAKVRLEAANIITNAKSEAESVRLEVVAKTREEQEKLLTQAKAQMENERSMAVTEVKREIAGLVVSASEKILKEKIDTAKDKALITEAINEITK